MIFLNADCTIWFWLRIWLWLPLRIELKYFCLCEYRVSQSAYSLVSVPCLTDGCQLFSRCRGRLLRNLLKRPILCGKRVRMKRRTRDTAKLHVSKIRSPRRRDGNSGRCSHSPSTHVHMHTFLANSSWPGLCVLFTFLISWLNVGYKWFF